MTTRVYRFEKITHTARKRVPCTGGCGKKLARQRTFDMTLNPFNRNPDGSVRTRNDIHEALKKKARVWQDDTTGEWCEPCAELADDGNPYG